MFTLIKSTASPDFDSLLWCAEVQDDDWLSVQFITMISTIKRYIHVEDLYILM